MQKTKKQKLLDSVVSLCKDTGYFIREELSAFGPEKIEEKSARDYVSYVDRTAEQMLVKALRKLLPEAGFIAEENTAGHNDEYYKWIVDPLDGTTNYIHKLPCFSISIALMAGDHIILGVVYEVMQDECFTATDEDEARLNGKIIRVSSCSDIKDGLYAAGFPHGSYEKLPAYLEVFEWLIRNTHGVRRLGSAAVDLAYVACGRLEGFYEYGLNPWDVAAGILIVEQAGGSISSFTGKGSAIFDKEILASNTKVHPSFTNLLSRYFK